LIFALQHTTLLRLLVPTLCFLLLLRGYVYIIEGGSDATQPENENSFSYLAEHCANMKPIPTSEFHARQQALAKHLHALGAVAYIAEPGPNAQYFANLSLSQWWLSERPFLLMITPLVQELQGEGETQSVITPRVSIITPQFESSRARLLQVPASGNVTFIEWAESEDPYEAVLSVLHTEYQLPERRWIFMDEDTRYFVVDGIKHRAPDFIVESSPVQIRSLRERKSKAELALLRCVNEARDFPSESEIPS
jgi:Xaa-Pro aminopeptidase